MKVLTIQQVHESFRFYEDLGDDRLHYDGEGVHFRNPEAACITLEYPPKLERLIFFARYLTTLTYEQHDFRGALIWFTGWGIWNDQDEGVAYRIIEQMNRSAGQNHSFEVGPGHDFRADEFSEAVGMLMQPMIIGWDAYYLPRWSHGTEEFFLHVSHDSYVTVVTKTKTFRDQVFEQMTKLDLNPKVGDAAKTNRFCRR